MFFIVGSARSGTTLLRMMLNAHPEVAVPPESRFVVELYRSDDVQVNDFLERLDAHPRWTSWDTPIEDVRAQLAGLTTVPYPEAIEAAYMAYAQNRNKKRYGDKTPRYIEDLPLLARLWPEAKFVHLVRDGREVALSYADVPFGPSTVAKAAALWKDRVVRGMEQGRPLGPHRYTELRYERLLANPQAEVEALCAFLDLDFDPSMLDYSERAGSEVLDRGKALQPQRHQIDHEDPLVGRADAAVPGRGVRSHCRRHAGGARLRASVPLPQSEGPSGLACGTRRTACGQAGEQTHPGNLSGELIVKLLERPLEGQFCSRGS